MAPSKRNARFFSSDLKNGTDKSHTSETNFFKNISNLDRINRYTISIDSHELQRGQYPETTEQRNPQNAFLPCVRKTGN